ncbi:ABC transporter ATP-binding protein [Amnibacterium sp. CER49]|uniref:ABC transporter ATP-binding protein n=1 Tax=Amnibacterium sp. CER49 TaxID=3039161 RepID=UPI002449E24E|nr:ABC transporter ATP-binding protein [Amnibacterium sp. CER49]MDH2443985.1 ABC transporter ATP-binding protein [Amnibacterium sp. CER49]
MTVLGVAGEERGADLTKAERRQLRRRSVRLLGSLLQPLKGRLVLTVLVVVLSTALQALGPAIIAWGIDTGLPSLMKAHPLPLVGAVVVYLVAGVLAGTTIAAYTIQTARISQAILIDLRKRVFLQTQRLSLEFHETYTSGRIISRQTSDLDSIRELLDGGINQLVMSVLYMLFTAVGLVLVDPESGLVLACSFVPLAALLAWFQRRSEAVFRESRVASAKLIVFFVETMTGIRAVQAFRKEQRNEAEYGALAEDYRRINADAIKLFAVLDPGLTLIGNLTVAVVLLIGGFRVATGGMAIGVLLAAVLYTRRFFDPMEDLATFYNAYQAAAAALEKVSGVLEERPSVPEPLAPKPLPASVPGAGHGHVRFDDVRFSYREGREVLPRFELDVPSGQTIALVGSTGAGKSTLAKLIARFYDPSEGRITLDGVDLRDLSSADLHAAVVMVTQEAYLFSGTVADNIALGKPGASRDEIVAAARAVGADPFIRGLPDGYDSDVNKRGGRVSAGQRQLISFARAFLADPAVLILDEATASLDIPSERLVQEALQTLLADRTALIIAHRLSTVAIADRVLVMERGRIVEDGPPEDLIAGTGRFASLHAAWRESLV